MRGAGRFIALAIVALRTAYAQDIPLPECKLLEPYPQAEWPCLVAMQELSYPQGAEIVGTTAQSGTCAVSIRFEHP